jgi:hypothetical protein
MVGFQLKKKIPFAVSVKIPISHETEVNILVLLTFSFVYRQVILPMNLS